MSKELIVLLVMIPFYGLAIFMIVRTMIVALSFRDPVPFVPVEGKLLKKAVHLLSIQPGDRVIDIGSGSGKMVVSAARQYPAANFTGIDVNRSLLFWSRFMAWLYRCKNCTFIKADAREIDYSPYNKVFMYMTGGFVAQLIDKLAEELPPGAIVVSVAFGFGRKFEEENSVEVYELGKKSSDKVSVWRKPANL